LLLALTLTLPCITAADPIPLPTTGLNVPTGQVDPNWTVDGGAPTYAVVPNPNWVPIAGAQWITIHDQWLNDPPGLYNFSAQFDLSNYVLSTVQISLTWSSDNASTFYLNGVDEGSIGTFVGSSYSYQTTNTISLTGLNATENTLLFAVTNGGDGAPNAGPVGLIAEFTGTGTPVPEPGTIAALALGAVLIKRPLGRRARAK